MAHSKQVMIAEVRLSISPLGPMACYRFPKYTYRVLGQHYCVGIFYIPFFSILNDYLQLDLDYTCNENNNDERPPPHTIIRVNTKSGWMEARDATRLEPQVSFFLSETFFFFTLTIILVVTTRRHYHDCTITAGHRCLYVCILFLLFHQRTNCFFIGNTVSSTALSIPPMMPAPTWTRSEGQSRGRRWQGQGRDIMTAGVHHRRTSSSKLSQRQRGTAWGVRISSRGYRWTLPSRS
jgi:hypothetical protein